MLKSYFAFKFSNKKSSLILRRKNFPARIQSVSTENVTKIYVTELFQILKLEMIKSQDSNWVELIW